MANALAQAETPLQRLLTRRPTGSALLFVALLAFLAFLIIYPIALLLIASFQVGVYGQETTFGFANWQEIFASERMREAMINTFSLAITRQAIGTVIAVLLAWLIARTNLPGKGWLEFGFWIAFFMPTLTMVLGWIVLFDSHRGLVNEVLVRWVPFINEAPFEIFSWWGIVFAHLMSSVIPLKVMLLAPAFRNLDASLEEASRASGASTPKTILKIVIPLMMPPILIVTLLGIINSMQAFEIELILGRLDSINIFSTIIYRDMLVEPPRFGTATAMSILFLLAITPFVLFQQWFVRRRSHISTLSGKSSVRVQDLGRWKWPVFWAVVLLLAFMTIIPVLFLFISTFQQLFGFFFVPDPWTLDNWIRAFDNPALTRAFRNTMLLGGGAALLSMTAFITIAYLIVRTRFRGRGLLDFLTWVPTIIPGIIIGLGFLWAILNTPVLRPLYGSMWILVVAISLGVITIAVQMLKTNIMQIGQELEEASWASGAGRVYTVRRIIAPLIAPAIAVVGILAFATAARATSLVALLATGSSKPLSLVQLDHMFDGAFGAASVIGVVLLIIILAAAILAKFIGEKFGVAQR
ncbi:MAG: iron ABC transporter permease [Nitrospirales bacterium]